MPMIFYLNDGAIGCGLRQAKNGTLVNPRMPSHNTIRLTGAQDDRWYL